MLARLNPPFRAEHIGSLLRPPELLALRARFAKGEIDHATLAAAENRAIKQVLALQKQIGFKFATDGEFRRRSYHSYFYRRLGDISIDTVGGESPSSGSTLRRGTQPVARIDSRVHWAGPIHVEDFKFIAANTDLVPKITIPGPCALHFRGGDAAVLARAYTDVDHFWEDIVTAFDRELEALAAAGCRYIQIDETAFAKFGDAEILAWLKARGDDPLALIDKYIAITNRVLANAPRALHIGMHLCRGNRGGKWHAEGGYEPVAERLFNELAIGFFLLEYDSPRAGGFAPLRLVPPHKTVVLGLVSTKNAELERPDELKRRIDEAARYVDIDRLAISPQCGFAGIETGNPISPQMQERKLRLVVELAREIWGDA
ncbi:MAG: 5-methyltetrahydropteroyltriglutamate--homocysteine S-methyltransferase [Pseudolabrys sp.]|nr:5-methyltetrahydropteroyltriglutamate--homocysteine S-methyltransferase [Pseudolabrys sp.]